MSLRGALLGCGQVSFFHLAAWQAIEEVEIVALYNRTRRAAEARAAEFGIPLSHVYDDVNELFKREKIDFADVATAPQAHRENVLTALEYGLPVLCQKPLALSLHEAQEMIEAAEGAGVLLCANENWRWRAWYLALKQLIDAGTIGEPGYVRITKRSNITLPGADGQPPPLAVKQPYTVDMDKLIVFEWGTHILDVLRFLFGEITSVYAHMDHVSPYFHGEDRVLMILRVDKVSAVFDASWASPGSPPQILEHVRVEGERGVIEIVPDNPGRISIRTGDKVWERPAFEGTSEEAYQASYTAAQRHFIHCLLTGETPQTVATDNIKTLRATFAAYQSAEQGKNVILAGS